MIPAQDQEILRRTFERALTNRVRLDLFTQRPVAMVIPGRTECMYCEDAQTLTEEIASLSRNVSLTIREFADSQRFARKLGVARIPATVIRGLSNRPVCFSGMPIGAQFEGFVKAILEAGGNPLLEPQSIRQIESLPAPVKLQVLVSPLCEHSPAVALTAMRLGLQSRNVHVEVVEAMEFPEVAFQAELLATPTLVFNEEVALRGSIDEATMVDCLVRVADGSDLPGDIQAGPTTPFGIIQQPEEQPGSGGLILPG